MILRSATLVDGSVVDVRLADGLIAEIGEISGGDEQTLDLHGHLLLPGLVEPHLHLDTVFSGNRGGAGAPGLDGAVDHWLAARALIDGADVHDRAERAVALAARRGVTAMRAHVDVGAGIELRGLEALLALRDEWRSVIDIELVAMGDLALTGTEGTRGRAWLEAAVEAGADVVGGAPALDPDPERCVDYLLAVASGASRPVDLHVDETLDPASPVLDAFVRAVVDGGFAPRATASHCASLAMRAEQDQHTTAAAVAAAGIAVIALPATNLYLLGRDFRTARPRGMTALEPLAQAGVVVAAGADNVRDAFNPVGTPDPLRTAELLVIAGQISPEAALRAVTSNARSALGLPEVELRPGSPADLVAVPGSTLEEALSETGEDRIVIKGGRIVARSSLLQTVAPAAGIRGAAPA